MMVSPILVLLLVLMALWPPVIVSASEVEREPLDRLWENLMLQGVHGAYSDGRAMPFAPTDSPESAKGSPGSAGLKTRGIAVHDFQGTAMLGLLRGGGWTLDGGLLSRVGPVELYAKRVWRFYPGLFGIEHYIKLREEETYEFFLLERETGEPRARLVKKWIVVPQEIRWFVKPETLDFLDRVYPGDEQMRRQMETTDVHGFLKYDPETREAEVTITGLTHPFVERVKISTR